MPQPPAFIKERSYDLALELISGTFKRMEELDHAVEWALTHNPTFFQKVAGDFYIWKTEAMLPYFPPVRVLYRYDQARHTVYLITIEQLSGHGHN